VKHTQHGSTGCFSTAVTVTS